MSDTVELEVRKGREGNRWVNERPSGEEVAEWFKTAFTPDDEALGHDHFIGGITLIQATEKTDEVIGFDAQGKPQIVKDVQNVFYVPYPKVETRIDYFRQWMALRNDWLGMIEPVIAPASGGMTEGFNPLKVETTNGNVGFICCTMRVRVLKRTSVEWHRRKDVDGHRRLHPEGEVIMLGAPGTKAVPMLDRYGKADANAVMKAQTGAAGRALGLAGIFVLPGTGVATAEDVLEAQTQGQTQPVPDASGTGAPAPEPFEDAGKNDDKYRQDVVEMIAQLESRNPDGLEEFRAWAKERGFTKLNEIGGPELKGVVRKLQGLVPAPDVEADISGTET
jgi:hypothetical protein